MSNAENFCKGCSWEHEPCPTDECSTCVNGSNRAQLCCAAAPKPAPKPVPHSDDAAVDLFAAAMKEKLARKRIEGRKGWEKPAECSVEFLSSLLHGHVHKGDPVDIGNIAMMLWNRGCRGNGSIPQNPAPDHFVDADMVVPLPGEVEEAVKRVAYAVHRDAPKGFSPLYHVTQDDLRTLLAALSDLQAQVTAKDAEIAKLRNAHEHILGSCEGLCVLISKAALKEAGHE